MRSYLFAGTTMTLLVGGDETGGRFTLLHVIKPPGSSTPPHSHDNETEISYVLSGGVSVETGGYVTDLREGELCILPPQRPHRIFNDSETTARELLLCSPAVFDHFVAAVGLPTDAFATPRVMTAEDRERLVELAPHYGIRLFRPAPMPDSSRQRARPGCKSWNVMGTRMEFVGQTGQLGDDLALVRVYVPPGGTVALQSDPDPACLFVVDGALEIHRSELPSAWSPLNENHAMCLGVNVTNSIRNSSGIPVRALLVMPLRMTESLQTSGTPGGLS